MVPALLGPTAPQGRETIDHTGRRLVKEKAKVDGTMDPTVGSQERTSEEAHRRSSFIQDS